MAFQPGSKYPVAFLMFKCSECTGNYLNHARSSVTTQFSKFDPSFTGERKILSGDLLPHASKALCDMISDSTIAVDLHRVDAPIAACLSSGKWPGEMYIIGIVFTIEEGVEILHNSMKEANVAGYRGLFTIPIVAGSSDIFDLSNVLSLYETPIGDRV